MDDGDGLGQEVRRASWSSRQGAARGAWRRHAALDDAQHPQVEVRERIDEDNEPLVLPKSNSEKLREDLEKERTPAAERAFYREIARLNGDASIAMKPNTRVRALNKVLSKLGYGEKYDPDAEAVYREFLQVAPGVALKVEGADRPGAGCALAEATR